MLLLFVKLKKKRSGREGGIFTGDWKNSNKYRKKQRTRQPQREESSDVLSTIKDLFGYSLKYERSDKDHQTIYVYINLFYCISFQRIQ